MMKTTAVLFIQKPHTRPGWWSVWLGAAFVVLFLINSFVFMPTSSDAPWRHIILPFYGIFMLLCGLAAGIVGGIAVACQHERSSLGWFTLVPGLLVLFLLLGEFLFPH